MISRRRICAAAAGGAVFARLALARAAVPDAALGQTCVAAIRARLAVLPPGPVLLHSYIVRTGPGADQKFDLTQANAAYVYDNALAGILLLAAGHPDEARRIGAALKIAQDNDRFYHDGRLRNAYRAGPMSAPAALPGWWDQEAGHWVEDPYQAGAATGPIAWAMLLWAALSMREPADFAGDFLDANLRAPSGYYGGFYGFEPHPLKQIWQSTEQNTDLLAAYRALGRAQDSAHAAGFVKNMWDEKAGRFATGLGPDGTKNPRIAADAGIWPYLAGVGTPGSARTAIETLARGPRTVPGIGFSDASQTVWPEGTAFAALALSQMSDARAPKFFATLRAALSPDGYVFAATAPVLATGFSTGPAQKPGAPETPFTYFHRPSLSATAWTGLAALGFDPLAA